MVEFDEFVAIMRRLRKECPWDKEQTHETLKKFAYVIGVDKPIITLQNEK